MFLAVPEAAAPPVDGIPPGPSFYRYADDDSFAALLADAGLVDVEVRDAAFTCSTPSAGALWESLLEGSVRSVALVHGQTATIRGEILGAFDRLVDSGEVCSAGHITERNRLDVREASPKR